MIQVIGFLTNRLAYIRSRKTISRIIALRTIMHMDPSTHDGYKGAYMEDEELREMTQ